MRGVVGRDVGDSGLECWVRGDMCYCLCTAVRRGEKE